MPNSRPSMFIGSSSEGLQFAKAMQQNLDRVCEVTLWTQGVFGLGEGTLETLVEKAPTFDFAVLVVTPDDLSTSRGRGQQAPRDNVLLEAGLFLGALGRKRTFVVHERIRDLKLPSDFAGVTLASFERHSDDNHVAAVGAACSQLEIVVAELGRRVRQEKTFDVDSNTHFQIICDLLDVVQRQLFILMNENNLSLSIERNKWMTWGVPYAFAEKNGSSGQGSVSVHQLCTRLADADLLVPDLRDNVALTERGRKFAKWLIDNNHRVDFFRLDGQGWGSQPESFPAFPGMPPVPEA